MSLPPVQSKLQAGLLSFSETLQKVSDLPAAWAAIQRYSRRIFSSEVSLHLHAESSQEPAIYDPLLGKFHMLIETSRSSMLNYDTKAQKYQIGAPLSGAESFLGSIVLSRPKHDYTPTEIEAADDFAGLISLSLSALLLELEQDYQQQQIDLIARVTSQIAQITNLDELSREVTRLIQKTFGYYYVAIFTLQPGAQHLDFKASSSVSESAKTMFIGKNRSRRIPLGTHIVGNVAQSGRHILANNVSAEPRFVGDVSLPETQSELAVPLKASGEVLGVLDIESDKRDAFSRTDLSVMTALANNIAFAIQRLRLFDSLEERNEQLQAIDHVSHSINSILDLDELLQHVTDLLHQEFNYPYVHIFLVNYVPQQIEFKAGSGARAEIYRERNIAFDIEAGTGIIPETVRSGQMQHLPDVSHADKFLPNLVTGTRKGSELSFPLGFGSQILGVLDVQSDQSNAFSSRDMELLGTLASTISIALRNANLYNSEKWRRHVAENLRDIALMLSDDVSVPGLLRSILSKLMEVLPCDVASIWLLKESEDHSEAGEQKLTLYSSRVGDEAYPPLPELSLNPSETWYKAALDEDETVIYTPNAGGDPIAQHYGFGSQYSAVAAPLTTAGKQLGLLVLHHHSKGRYGMETRSICSSFAGYAAIALQNEDLLTEARAQAWVSTILLQVTLATQSLSTLEELSAIILHLLILVLDGSGSAIVLADPESGAFQLHAMCLDKQNEVLQVEVKDLQDSPALQAAAQSSQIVALPAVDFDPQINSALCLGSKDTLLLVPLLAHEQRLGFLLHASHTPYIDLEPEQVLGAQRYAILQGFAQQVALSVQNIRLITDREEEAYVANLLLQTSRMFYASGSLDDSLKMICDTLLMAGGFSGAMVLEAKPQRDQYQIRSISSKRFTRYQEYQFLGRALGRAKLSGLRGGRTEAAIIKSYEWFLELGLLPSPPQDAELPRRDQPDPSRDRIILLPLEVNQADYGFLVALESGKKTNQRRLDLLKGIAQQIAYAIQNDELKAVQQLQELTEKEFQMARQIQRTFLPEKLPELPGHDLDAVWQTARQVGGDFYDVFRLGDRHVGFVIADVSDKGFPAALYMTVTRTLIRATALDTLSTAETLEKVNRLLQLDSQEGFFVTLFYAILDLPSGQLRYTVAGHNPPILMQTGQPAVLLPRGGIALGVMEEIQLQERELSLAPGSSLVMYTDGVTEATNPLGNFYGQKRFLGTLNKNSGHTAAQIIQATLSDLESFRNQQPFNDDITQMVLRRL